MADRATTDEEVAPGLLARAAGWSFGIKIAVSVVVLWVLALGIVTLVDDDGDGDGDATEQVAAPDTTAATPPTAPPGPFVIPVPTIPVEPTEPPPAGSVVDGFDRAGDVGLSDAPDPSSWEVVSGSWSTDGGAAVPGYGPDGLALVVDDAGAADGVIGATAGHITYGASLVFRYAGPDDHWLLRLAPGLGMQLVEVVGGQERVIDYILVFPQDGIRFGVTLRGDVIEVWTGLGRWPVSYQRAPVAGATGFGLLSVPPGPGDTTSTFDQIERQPA